MFEAPDRRHQPDNDLTLLRVASKSTPPAAGQQRPQPNRRSRWPWLLVVAVVVPLLTPLYNHIQPRLFGLPFFYWSQMAFVVLAACVTATVYLATKRRGS